MQPIRKPDLSAPRFRKPVTKTVTGKTLKAFKEKHKSDMIISTFNKFIEYGILDIDIDDRLTGIHEKTFSVPINAGF